MEEYSMEDTTQEAIMRLVRNAIPAVVGYLAGKGVVPPGMEGQAAELFVAVCGAVVAYVLAVAANKKKVARQKEVLAVAEHHIPEDVQQRLADLERQVQRHQAAAAGEIAHSVKVAE